MKSILAATLTAAMLTVLPAMADQAKPKIKNKEERAALQKLFADTDPDSQLADANTVLENYSDTEYKAVVLSIALRAAEQKDDLALVQTWSQRTLQSDPNNIEAHVVLAHETARKVRENDLDKADSLKTIDTNANQALTMLKAATTAPAAFPEAQWPAAKAQMTSETYEALGMAAAVEKKNADAVAAFKMGADADPTNSIIKARLTKAYNDNKQYDDAIATADAVLANTQAPQVVKNMVQQQKDFATKMKAK